MGLDMRLWVEAALKGKLLTNDTDDAHLGDLETRSRSKLHSSTVKASRVDHEKQNRYRGFQRRTGNQIQGNAKRRR